MQLPAGNLWYTMRQVQTTMQKPVSVLLYFMSRMHYILTREHVIRQAFSSGYCPDPSLQGKVETAGQNKHFDKYSSIG